MSKDVAFLCGVFNCIANANIAVEEKSNFINLLACNKCVENIDKVASLEETGLLSDLPFSPILVGDYFSSQKESTSTQP